MGDETSRIEEVSGLDRVVHEPARLSILYTLSGGGSADFMFLQSVTGVTAGSLSKHLDRLEEAGLIEIRKEFVLRRPKTRISITQAGKAALEEHWRQLNELREKSREKSEQVRAADQHDRGQSHES